MDFPEDGPSSDGNHLFSGDCRRSLDGALLGEIQKLDRRPLYFASGPAAYRSRTGIIVDYSANTVPSENSFPFLIPLLFFPGRPP